MPSESRPPKAGQAAQASRNARASPGVPTSPRAVASATAASSGADLNGMAARAAAQTLKGRLVAFAAEAWSVAPETVLFLPNRVRVGNQEIAWATLIHKAYLARIQLSATGFYKTPEVAWDRIAGRGLLVGIVAFTCGHSPSRTSRSTG